MATQYEVYLANQFGENIAFLDTFKSLSWQRVLNGIGSYTISFPGSQFDFVWWGLDRQLKIYRIPDGAAKQLVMVGFMRYIEEQYQGDNRTIFIKGVDGNELLTRRIINYAAGSSEAKKTGPGDDVMKEFVDEAMGPSAPAADDLTSLGFSIEADLGAAPSISLAVAKRNLLDVLLQIADNSRQAGTRLYWDIVNPTPETFEFRTYINQRGVDRTTGNARLVFSPEFGNVVDPVLIRDFRNEATIAVVGGGGEGTARAIETVTATDRATQSAWNRRYTFVDARNSGTDPTTLQDKGNSRLNERRPLVLFSAGIQNVINNRYGVNWNLGDRVIAQMTDFSTEAEITSVQGQKLPSGMEKITARIESI